MAYTLPPIVSGSKPLIGHAAAFNKNKYHLFARGFQEHGAMYTLKMPAGHKMFILHSPDYAQTVFEQTDHTLDIGKGLGFLKAFLGDLLSLGGVEQYYLQRPLAYENFKHKRVAGSIEAMNIEVMRWLTGLGTEGEIDLQETMVRLTQEIASLAFFGAHFKEKIGKEYWTQFGIIGDAIDFILPAWLPIPKFRRREKAKKVLYRMVEDILEERSKSNDTYDDFLQTLIETPLTDGSYIDSKVATQAIMFLSFAGHETTAIQAAWTVLLLLQHPMYLQLVRSEIDEHIPPGAMITPELLMKLTHTFWAVDETTRLRPSGEVINRIITEDIQLGGYDLPKGNTLMMPVGLIQRMPELFTNPEAFDPLRFAPGREEHKLHPHSLLGFGGLTHKCAGMNFARNEIAIMVALMFQHLDWELISKPEMLVRPGGSRITESTVRYYPRKNPKYPTPALANYSREIIASCPHLGDKAKGSDAP